MRQALLCLLLSGCGPSCQEQGGKLIQDGYYYVWQWIDATKGIGYMQPHPNYVCIKE
jgi:hypothetical protein